MLARIASELKTSRSSSGGLMRRPAHGEAAPCAEIVEGERREHFERPVRRHRMSRDAAVLVGEEIDEDEPLGRDNLA
jgi:hypothetical protein